MKLLAPAYALALGVLATSATFASPVPDRPAAKEPVTVNVVNHDHEPIRIYAVVGAVSHRLGTVNARDTRTLVMPQSLVQDGVDVQLMALPVVHREYATFTNLIRVAAGDRLQFEVSEAMRSSRVSRTNP